MDNLETICARALKDASNAATLGALEDVRVAVLGKQGTLSLLMRELGRLDGDARKEAGQTLNQARDQITTAIEERKCVLEAAALNERLAREWVDVTLPPRPAHQGAVHPLSQAMFEVTEIFREMGFWIADGPDIEEDALNFDALNVPPEHPARQDHDTFYLPPNPGEMVNRVLRTHTSPVQIRTMLSKKPPLRIIAPGRVYRSDYDQTHTPTFHQVEGLYVDKGVHMGHLKGCIIEFCRRIFDRPDLPVRFRPSYFPFTEPSAEVDIGCSRTAGKIEIGGGDDWLEIMGCGMVHPKVLANCKVDTAVYSGFAFGMGIERIAMLKYGIPDLRSFYEGDQRWLRHYGYSAAEALMAGGVR